MRVHKTNTNQKSHRHRQIRAGSLGLVLLFIVTPLLLFINTVYAGSNDIQIGFEITNPIEPPFDACPNLPGIQPSVPPGMIIDGGGNCVYPPPPPVDMCLNLPGIQLVVPEGYYRTSDGNCYRQPTPPTPPVDLCPNLPGVQTSVPDGYTLDPDTNSCIPEPPDTSDDDLCPNLPGIQTVVPEGYYRTADGNCYRQSTPQPPTPPAPTPTPQEPPLKNLPDFLQDFGRFLVSLVPDFIKDFFRDLPADVVNQLPLYIFILALIFILIPIPQSIREYLYKRRLMAFYKREQSIAEEKENFMALASHYLRTPIATMKDSIPLMIGSGDITRADSNSLNEALKTLSDQISSSLASTETNASLNTPAAPSVAKPKPFWRSGFFWVPIVLSIVLTLIINFLIGVVGDREIGITNALFQLFIIIAFIVALYLIVRNYHIQKKLRQEKDALIAHERAIDDTRNQFIEQQTAQIGIALNSLRVNNASYPPSKPYTLYSDGLSRLKDVYSKFVVLPFVRTGGNRGATTFNLKTTVDNVIANEQTRLTDKKITVQNSVGNISLTQNESLFTFVINSVLDNAIKFSNSGGHIAISSHPQSKTIRVKVSDNGRGIDPAKLDQLFKPFSRAESAVDFGYEGLGLSLFLDRLILTYTGGNISATPRSAGGTDIIITTPINIKPLEVSVVNNTR
ncbi:ATP-binding protein [Candidatus Saccharibacteria bacterium]|nr:ATP-binding protein [Candidatus Saccharibacteria bacterium]